jgi:DNA-binding winged helix-turn-helix (wHTH) protein
MPVYEFDRFRVDPLKRLLLKDGEVVRIAPKTFDVLLALIERGGRTVAYDELIQSVWRGNASARTADNLKERVSRLRKALGDDRAAHQFIVTVPLEGYKFVAQVMIVDGNAASGTALPCAPPKAPNAVPGPATRGQAVAPRLAPSEAAPVEAKTGHEPRELPGSPRAHATRQAFDGWARAIPILGAVIIVIAAFVAGLRVIGGEHRADVQSVSQVRGSAGQQLRVDHADELLQAYRSGLEVLRRNLVQQFAFVVLAILLALTKGSEFNVPGLKMTVSTRWLRFVVPLVLIYLWLDFGFVLDNLIKWRGEAWSEIADTGDMVRASAFNDGGFMDGWFMCFRPAEHAINTNFVLGSAFFFCSMYYPLFAANHACAVTLLQAAVRPSKSLRLLPWFAALAIVLSHVQFWFGGSNPNWGQPAVVGLALLIGYALHPGDARTIRHRESHPQMHADSPTRDAPVGARAGAV